ncbi:hypothetical protein [Cesiribacter sp. SM1]|uniref:hypothetical protein n=1 Tax=Cesiribacter sp. SM1 TaxID=2861196 RepID=UPI001CD7C696|nr:hypothetical protein [Cesiribacter sp. SM1]
MKKQHFLLALIAFCSFAFSNPDSKVFTTKEIVWCGIDFSEAKCIGSDGFNEPDQVKDRYFSSWNELVLTESDKYDVQKFYSKNKQTNDLSVVNKRNEMPEVDELVINEPYAFKEGQLEKIIKSYDLEMANEGLGVVYVVESLNKTEQEAVINVVFFDIASKNILWNKQYKESPKGFGFRNYWAGAIYKTMRSSEKDYESAMKKASKTKASK